MPTNRVISVPNDLYDQLKAESESTGQSIRAVLVNKLTMCHDPTNNASSPGVSQQVDPPAAENQPPSFLATNDISLDTACDVLLNHLPGYALLVRDMVHETRHPAWVFVLSQLALIVEQGNASYFDGQYLTDIKPNQPASTASTSSNPSTCEWCHHAFTPINHGQRYCSNDCGKAAYRASLPKRSIGGTSSVDEAHPSPPPAEFAPPQKSADELAVYLQGIRGAPVG